MPMSIESLRSSTPPPGRRGPVVGGRCRRILAHAAACAAERPRRRAQVGRPADRATVPGRGARTAAPAVRQPGTHSERTVEARSAPELDHPVIDSDGHAIEYLPVLRRVSCATSAAAGRRGLPAHAPARADRTSSTPDQCGPQASASTSWWGLPDAQHARPRHRDAARAARTSASTSSASTSRCSTRRTGSSSPASTTRSCAGRCRERQPLLRRDFRPFADRLLPVGIVPMYTPEEAIDELDYAVGELGLQAS